MSGVDQIEVLVIDDGSDDGTAEIAEQLDVDYVIRQPLHSGLAAGFVAGLEASLKAGADVIINTDADNQYRAEDMPRLLEPILSFFQPEHSLADAAFQGTFLSPQFLQALVSRT